MISTPERATVATKLILFDLDDTLCDYAGARAIRLRQAFAVAFSIASPTPTPDMELLIEESIAMHPHGADHFAELLMRYGVTVSDAPTAARRWYQTNRFHGLRLFDDAIPTLTVARTGESRRRLGLVTNGPAEVQRAKIELLGVEQHVDFVVVSGEFGVAKPDPSIFAHALDRGGARAGEALFVGDSAEFDIAGAYGAGIRSVWVNRTGRPWDHRNFAPDHEVQTLTELQRLLREETT